jgi:hypothetical protein
LTKRRPFLSPRAREQVAEKGGRMYIGLGTLLLIILIILLIVFVF